MRPATPLMTPVRAWLLAMLLLVSQAAGLVHRIVHATPAGGATAQAVWKSEWRAVWKADHQPGSTDCRLVDQLTHADALSCGTQVLAALQLPADTAVALGTQALQARTAAPYLARGPPLG